MVLDPIEDAGGRFERPYAPQAVEERWYRHWLDRQYFSASNLSSDRPRFSIVIPPPNITGSLHLGHALNNTLQDILVRWKRMQGVTTLWLPGTDHAGIATQNVVERQLMSSGTSREALGRVEFIKRIWAWREESGRTIISQLKRLGASCDWSRERFTLDEGLSAAVREVFVRLHQEGLIYRGERLINWCPRCGTALSDIEVEHEETRGKMYHIQYPFAGDPAQFLTVATTRPETMLGDTAVAVHPEDPRYNERIGQSVLLPLTGRRIPVVGDPILVDRKFGTGAVKITPAHDFNDEKAGQRHRLPRISLLNQRGEMDASGLEEGGVVKELRIEIAGVKVHQAREIVVRRLEAEGFLLKTEDHRHTIGKCYRCKTVVEPFLSPQWFVKVNDPENSLAAPAIEAVRTGRIRVIPEGWKNNYLGWMEQIQDWCISRQIWWGHQIPAWYCREAETEKGRPECREPIVARAAPSRCPHCGSSDPVQDPDVLDTWFSSALWPFSTLGWPEKTKELEVFYPTSTLVTSFDILFFWVARMVMMGLKFMGEVPFRDVYIHALVRDAQGQKMSKSKGNVIDPLEIMGRYGTDALRFTLASMASPGRDIKLSEERIAGYRNFANKLWNAARFIHLQADLARLDRPEEHSSPDPILANRWILTRLSEVIDEVHRALEGYRFDEVCRLLYHFSWHEFCDWYIEFIKPILAEPGHPARTRTLWTFLRVFDAVLRMLHPIMPFVTEEIWQTLPSGLRTGDSLVTASFPGPGDSIPVDIEARDLTADMIEIVSRLRSLRSERGLSPTLSLSIVVQTRDARQARELQGDDQRRQILQLGRLGDLVISDSAVRPKGSVLVSSDRFKGIWVILKGVVDPVKERDRLEAERGKIAAQTGPLEKKLSDPGFREGAPEEIRLKDESRLAALRVSLQGIEDQLRAIRELED